MDDGLRSTVASRLQAVNQRATASRQTIVSVLGQASRPLTIPEILETPDGRSLAQSSVYRNLVVLEEAGLVRRVVTDDEFTRYELAEDLTEHHHHLVCVRCGRIEDVPADAHLERSLADATEEIARTTGFRTQHHRIDLVGLCRQCA
jgi:Fur family transcriptional regulator, ferric uptake regulator